MRIDIYGNCRAYRNPSRCTPFNLKLFTLARRSFPSVLTCLDKRRRDFSEYQLNLSRRDPPKPKGSNQSRRKLSVLKTDDSLRSVIE